jgi:hypothetical protein
MGMLVAAPLSPENREPQAMAEFMVTPLMVRARNNENAFNAKSRMAGPFHCQIQQAFRCNPILGYKAIEI